MTTNTVDPYGLLQVSQDASQQEIRSSYRKLARNCHPDKSSDPASVFVFHQLTEALNCLVTPELREKYDQELHRKQEKIRRDIKLDSKEQKLRRDLEEREIRSAKEENEKKKHDEILEYLRNEACQLLEEEHDNIVRKLSSLGIKESTTEEQALIKVKWDNKCLQYSKESLLKIFTKYGEVENVVVKKTSALIEFKCLESACIAFKAEQGFEENPLTLKPFFSRRTGLKYIFVTYPCMLSWPNDIEMALTQLEKFVLPKLLTS